MEIDRKEEEEGSISPEKVGRASDWNGTHCPKLMAIQQQQQHFSY